MTMKTMRLAALFGLLFAVAAPGHTVEAPPANPREGESPQSADKSGKQKKTGLMLEEVLVTASKREESFRVVPSSVSVMTGEDLEKIGATDFLDFLDHLPNVSTGGRGKGASRVIIRGVTSGAATNPAGIYVDETPIGSVTALAGGAAAQDFIALDMKRVEVLAGPQGTLYGSGAMGGLLKYVTNDPDPNGWEARAEYEESSISKGGNSRQSKATVNIPLSEDIAGIRVSALHEDFGGYVDNPRRGIEDQDETETDAFRVSLLFNLPSDLRLKLVHLEQRIDRAGNPTSDRDGRTREPTGGDLEETAFLAEPWKDAFRLSGLELGWNIGDVALFGWDIGDISLLSNTTTSTQNRFFSFDVTRIFGAILGTGDEVLWDAPDWTEVDRTTQEFRLTSASDGKFEWQLGAFYAHEDSSQHIFVVDTENRLLEFDELEPVTGGVTGTIIPGPSELTTGGLTGVDLFDGLLLAEYDEVAVFASVTYSITEKFDITAGYRWGRIEQDYFQSFSGVLGNPRNPSEPLDDTESTKDIVRNYLFNPRYFLTDDIMFYFRAADGFRAGGPNFIIRDPVTNEPRQHNSLVEPDELENFELGAKTAFLDNRLTVDAAVYTIRWDNIQLFVTRDGTNNLENGGKARIDGAEFTTRYQPFTWLAVTGSAMTSDARLEEDVPPLGARDGQRLELSPEFSSSILVDTFFNVTDWLSLTASLTYTFTGERNQGFEGSELKPLYKLSQYETYGARVSLGFPYFDLIFFAKNIKDARGELGANTADFAEDSDLPVRATVMQPRTVGASIRFKY